MRRRGHLLSPWQVYADQLLLLVGAFLLISSLLMVIPHVLAKNKDADKPKAEFLITLSWDDGRDVDLDEWLEYQDCVIYYHNRECKNISLDRDSLGFTSNHKQLPNGTIVQSANREVIAIRAIMPGDYIVGVSYYSGRDSESGFGYRTLKTDAEVAIDCVVEIEKINPNVVTVTTVRLHLVKVKETQNAVAFHVDEDGSVTILPLPPDDMISSHQKLAQ